MRALALVILWFSCYTTRFFYSPDAYDDAQIGRQWAKTRAMNTLQLFPRHLAYWGIFLGESEEKHPTGSPTLPHGLP